MKSEKLYLIHIVEANVLIEKYVAHGKKAFLSDDMIQNAIIKVVGNIAESASHINVETKEKYPQISWDMVRGFRNILIHDYLGDLDLEIVWEIIQGKLQQLVLVAKKILQDKYSV